MYTFINRFSEISGKKKHIVNYLVCLLLILSSFKTGYSQSYGLGFYGHDVHQDKRTGLDISPGKTICLPGDFELSFDLSFRPNFSNYFGYIVRIIEDDKANFDFIYDAAPKDNKRFKLTAGDQYTKISFNIEQDKLFNQWNKIRLKFDFEKGILTLYANNSSYVHPINLKKNGCYKILFGFNDYPGFNTIDVPPMIIRDVQIIEKDKLSYNWKLDEYDGLIAHEDIREKNAAVLNPLWGKKVHLDWDLIQSLTMDGEPSVSFDRKEETVYFAGKDSVLTYFIPKSRLTSFPSSGEQYLIRGNQSVYITELHSLLSLGIDHQQIAAFNFGSRTWNRKLDNSLHYTHFWHFNKFFSPADTSLYMFGGYGYFTYRNDVNRYHFPSGKWEKLKTTGSFFAPRYLAALGVTSSGAYILGGYGSITGEQKLNPKNFYDLLYFDVKTKTFKKIYELEAPEQDFVFANSMVIDEPAGLYYALTFPKNKYNTRLQMIAGSLKEPGFRMVGNSIPYLFDDVNSFADLFYCAASNRFVAVVLNHDEKADKTKIYIYSLNSPPAPAGSGIKNASITAVPANFSKHYPFFIILVASIIFFLLYKKYKTTKSDTRSFQPLVVNGHSISMPVEISAHNDEPAELKNAIFLFGDLQVFDAEGNDLTKYFTPLIKELFLVIILYTIRWGRGISSEKLEELLWFDKNPEKARNNRSVNIAKLKLLLEKMHNCRISKDTGYWKIDIDDQHIMVDYTNYLKIIKNKEHLDKKDILSLATIIRRGCFLSDVEFAWLDTFKSEITNEIIDTYLSYAATVNVFDDPEFMIKLANDIFSFDPVNEEAMIIKCKSLSHLGKHSLAKDTFENFTKEYRAIYGEEFEKDFHSVLE